MKNAELIADLQSNIVGDPFPLMRKAADATEALEAEVERLQRDFTYMKQRRNALQAQLAAAQTEVERLTSEAIYCSEYSEPEDLMFERIERAARTSFRKHKSSIRGQQITRDDSYESHLVWAAQQEMKTQLAAAPQPKETK